MSSTGADIGRAAGKMARKWMPAAKAVSAKVEAETGKIASQWTPSASQSRAFIKHVVPAAVKPIHSLWHEVLGFVFLVFAGLGIWKIWQHPGALPPVQLGIVLVFIVVMAAYGISSVRKARRISRS